MERWSGKVALVTGASAGIGASIAEQLAKHGLKVYAMARRVERIEELKQKLGKVKGEVIPVEGDVSKQDQIDATFNLIKQKSGAIHVLVNNAGIARTGLISEMKTQDFVDVINVNFVGLTICTQRALQLMKETNVTDGHIIHINSVAGHSVPNIGKPILNVYPGTKHAVTALTESLRQELNFLKTSIRVTSISPGYVATEIMEASRLASGEKELDPVTAKWLENAPSLQSKDISDAVIYTLSTPPHVQVHEIIIRPVDP